MMNSAVFFNGWSVLGRTLIVGVLAYIAMAFMLRISGKRTLAQMTAFDMIIPLALGPIMASTILLPDVALLQGLLAFALLVLLHSIVAWLSARSSRFRFWVRPEPTLLLHQGEFLWQAMRRERVTEGEVREAVRAHGLADLEQVGAVVLEADGDFNVIPLAPSKSLSSLSNVFGHLDSA